MQETPKLNIQATITVREEMIKLWNTFLIESADTYNKEAIKRARKAYLLLSKLGKRYRIETKRTLELTAPELRSYTQQKTTL